jgi:hypothetical protein
MLDHEMCMKIIAKDRFSARLMEAKAFRLAKTDQRSRMKVKVFGQLVVDVVAMLARVI